MNLWLDDLRPPPEGDWEWVKTADAAIALLEQGGISFASLDHDLGDIPWRLGDPCPSCGSDASPHFNGGDPWFECCNISVDEYRIHRMHNEKTGYDVVLWMAEHNVWPPEGIRIHSWNAVGGERMRGVVDRYGPYDTKCVHEPDPRNLLDIIYKSNE